MMQRSFIAVLLLLPACSDLASSLGPSEQQAREAYLETSDVMLGSELLNGELRLAEFKKIACQAAGEGLFRCKFYAKLGISASDREQKIVDHFIGSQSGYLREATFFQSPEGKWVCIDVANDVTNNSGAVDGQ